jgi:hypothetical protein
LVVAQKPTLEIEIDNHTAQDDNLSEDLTFRIKNTGRAVAKHSGFWVRLDNAEIKGVHDGLHDISGLNGGRPTVSFAHTVGGHPSERDFALRRTSTDSTTKCCWNCQPACSSSLREYETKRTTC